MARFCTVPTSEFEVFENLKYNFVFRKIAFEFSDFEKYFVSQKISLTADFINIFVEDLLTNCGKSQRNARLKAFCRYFLKAPAPGYARARSSKVSLEHFEIRRLLNRSNAQ